MKLGIPSMGEKGLEESISPHFGRGPTFTLYDSETDEVTVIENTSEHRGGTGQPPELLKENGVDIMLCANLGRRAVRLFDEYGIEVYCGAQGTVKDAIDAWKNDRLEKANDANVCDEGHKH
ncbi:MAG: NifB/NifX family molybdenum-iron cluster-binding protein [Thermoplasmatota archaeon]